MTQLIEIAQIVAKSKNNAIGKNNDLPWHLPVDLQHFKQHTKNGIVIMGRKTFESMGAKPLPNRTNIIISRNAEYQQVEQQFASVKVFADLATAIDVAKNLAKTQAISTIWIIGGEKVFEQALPISQRLEITEVQTQIDGATAFYPQIPENFQLQTVSEWLTDEKSGLNFRYLTYLKS